ncbi:MAG: hypothetical protein K6T73_01880 [Candidatus Bathyarchaeota archaeon]|nr:hypothetical protein [Candidatus Bathyarchaeota archaeon]
MYELNFVVDMVEEQIAKGHLRWLANFSEIHRDYKIGNTVFPIYASGSLREKGFFLSKIFSALVTPKYKINFLIYTSPTIDTKSFREMIISLKSKFGEDEWIFLGLVQNQPFDKTMKNTINDLVDKNIGVVAFSLASKENISSNNVLGKGLAKHLKLTEAKFEIFDLPNYMKSFIIILGLGILFLVAIALAGWPQAVQPLPLLIVTALSLVGAYRLYKSNYHTVLSLNSQGFTIQEGKTVREGKWSDFTDATMYVTPKREVYIKLYSEKETMELPISRAGMSRKDAYNTIKQLIRKK